MVQSLDHFWNVFKSFALVYQLEDPVWHSVVRVIGRSSKRKELLDFELNQVNLWVFELLLGHMLILTNSQAVHADFVLDFLEVLNMIHRNPKLLSNIQLHV